MIQALNGYLRRIPAWPVYVIMVAYFAWIFWLALTGQSGPDPVRALEHSLGDVAIKLFVVVIAITPLRKFVGLNLIKFRRALGLAVFFYVTMHLAVWLFLDVQIWEQVWKDIAKRPYITVGMVAFVMILPLALTSNNKSIRKLGPLRWRNLHMLSYPAVVLGAVHNVMVQKVWETEPLVYLGLIVLLLTLRLPVNRFVPARA